MAENKKFERWYEEQIGTLVINLPYVVPTGDPKDEIHYLMRCAYEAGVKEENDRITEAVEESHGY